MVFGATAGCRSCRVRFAPRATCPSCGSSDVLRASGAGTFRAAAPAPLGLVVRLALLAPSNPWLVFAIGGALFAPAVFMRLVFGDTAFASLWLVFEGTSLDTLWRGLSPEGGALLAAAALGAVTMLAVVLTVLADRHVRAQRAASKPFGVWSPSADDDEDAPRETFAGVARLATATIASPITGEPCLVVGLHGRVDGAEIADAEGGDFDLELPNGERLMVSLEHAVLVCEGPSEPREVAPDDEGFDAFLQQRGLRRRARECRVGLCAVSDGSDVVVLADVAGAAITVGGAFRAPGGRARVLSGTEARPLVVRAVRAVRADQSPSSRSK